MTSSMRQPVSGFGPRQVLSLRISSRVSGKASSSRDGKSHGKHGSDLDEYIGSVSKCVSPPICNCCVSKPSCVAYSSNAFVALRSVECALGPSPKIALSKAFGDIRRTAQKRVLKHMSERFVGPTKFCKARKPDVAFVTRGVN